MGGVGDVFSPSSPSRRPLSSGRRFFCQEFSRARAPRALDDVLGADGYLFCAPENLASASGAMLDFFHRSYYHAFSASGEAGSTDYSEASLLLGRPYGLAIAAGSDGSSAFCSRASADR